MGLFDGTLFGIEGQPDEEELAAQQPQPLPEGYIKLPDGTVRLATAEDIAMLMRAREPALPVQEPDLDYDPIETLNNPEARGTVPPRKIVEPRDPETPESREDRINVLRKLVEPARQAGAHAIGSGALAYDLLSGLAAVPIIAGRAVGADIPDAAYKETREWAEAARRGGYQITGAESDPSKLNAVDRFGGKFGAAIMPMRGVSAPATIGLAAGLAELQSLIEPAPAEAASKAEREAAKAEREAARAAREQEKARREQAKIDKFNSGIEQTIQTYGGPAKVENGELWTMGGLVAASMGMMFAPWAYRTFKSGAVPRFREVEDTAPGTKAMSTPGDYARTITDDVDAGALRIAQRAGMPADVLTQVQKGFRLQSRAGAQGLAESAVLTGRAEAPNYSFQAKVALADLAKMDSPQVQQYLHLRDTFDDFQIAQARPKALTGAQPAPTHIRGLSEQDVLTQIGALEQANPELKQIGALYRDNLKQMRKFEANGEYATMSKSEERYANASRQNMVPFKSERVMDEAVERGSPFNALSVDMQTKMRFRMENEAKGLYIDEMRKVQPDTFVRVTPEQLKNNPHWKKNTVEMYRRGKLETYTTDPFLADVLRMDPYYISGMGGNVLHQTKRLLEKTTTGELAPWFAMTNAIRSWEIAKYTTRDGLSAPGIMTSTLAVPQQLYPQMAKWISSSIDAGSANWARNIPGIGGMLGKGLDATSMRLAKAYDESFFALMQASGSHRGSIMEQQLLQKNNIAAGMNKLNGAIASAADATTKNMLEAYRATLNSIHNAPSFAFARKNQGKLPLPELAEETRHLTGNPRIGGQYYAGAGSKPMRFDPGEDATLLTKIMTGAAEKTGKVAEIGRDSVPWFNYTMQGAKRIGEAYLENPVNFTRNMWIYSQMPAAGMYFYARSLGDDPNGVSYSDYQMNRRSNYAKTMFQYIPIYGKPAEDGIEIPRFHEMSIAARLMEVALDHAMRSSVFREGEDFMAAAKSFLGAAAMPPMPPLGSAVAAGMGHTSPQGIFGGDSFRRRDDPYDQTGGLPHSVELYARAFAGGLAEVVGAGAAAMIQTEDGFVEALKNGAAASTNRAVSKTALVRDIVGTKPPLPGSTQISEALTEKRKGIDTLVQFFDKWHKEDLDPKTGEVKRAAGDISTKAKSKAGAVIADRLLGPTIPEQRPGLVQPDPTNPLYKMFIEEVRQKFINDDPAKGGIGFQSLTRRYGDASQMINDLRKINEGNVDRWQDDLQDKEKTLEYLKANKVDVNDPRAVRNHYEKVRHDAARVILFTIRAVEEQMSKRLGAPVKIENLDPYKQPSNVPSSMFDRPQGIPY